MDFRTTRRKKNEEKTNHQRNTQKKKNNIENAMTKLIRRMNVRNIYFFSQRETT